MLNVSKFLLNTTVSSNINEIKSRLFCDDYNKNKNKKTPNKHRHIWSKFSFSYRITLDKLYSRGICIQRMIETETSLCCFT